MGEGDGEAGFTAAPAIPGPRIYSCCNCRCHVADHDEIISKCFQVRIYAKIVMNSLPGRFCLFRADDDFLGL
uniref:Yippee domain-containing protein n=1 Tax=Physcomitrium patens TaxID=3218 RepID=A0A7I3ZUW2_PHYPA